MILRTPREREKVRGAAEAVLRVINDAVEVLVEGHQAARRQMIRQEESARREFVDDLLRGDADVSRLVERAEPFGLDLRPQPPGAARRAGQLAGSPGPGRGGHGTGHRRPLRRPRRPRRHQGRPAGDADPGDVPETGVRTDVPIRPTSSTPASASTPRPTAGRSRPVAPIRARTGSRVPTRRLARPCCWPDGCTSTTTSSRPATCWSTGSWAATRRPWSTWSMPCSSRSPGPEAAPNRCCRRWRPTSPPEPSPPKPPVDCTCRCAPSPTDSPRSRRSPDTTRPTRPNGWRCTWRSSAPGSSTGRNGALRSCHGMTRAACTSIEGRRHCIRQRRGHSVPPVRPTDGCLGLSSVPRCLTPSGSSVERRPGSFIKTPGSPSQERTINELARDCRLQTLWTTDITRETVSREDAAEESGGGAPVVLGRAASDSGHKGEDQAGDGAEQAARSGSPGSVPIRTGPEAAGGRSGRRGRPWPPDWDARRSVGGRRRP